MNDEVWNELYFQFVKSLGKLENYRSIMMRFWTTFSSKLRPCQMWEQAQVQMKFFQKTLFLVRDVDIFSVISQTPTEELQALIAVLWSCALEAYLPIFALQPLTQYLRALIEA